MTITLRLAHSPDPDDAFMAWGLRRQPVWVEGDFSFRFELEAIDISTLNDLARRSVYDVTALSAHAYAHLADRYQLLSCGSSFGLNYGPLFLAGPAGKGLDWRNAAIAIPGEWTSALLALKIFSKNHPLQTLVAPFKEILPGIETGRYPFGLIIHEGQLTWEKPGLRCIVDFGQWWMETEGGPLPLGVNALRRDLPEKMKRAVARVIRRGLDLSLAEPGAALEYAHGFASDTTPGQTERFVKMYVNELSYRAGRKGREAILRFFLRATELGCLNQEVPVDFIEDTP